MATELDADAAATAAHNVLTNRLTDRIRVVLSPSPSHIFVDVVPGLVEGHGAGFLYLASMCNPPFYAPGETPANRTGMRCSRA